MLLCCTEKAFLTATGLLQVDANAKKRHDTHRHTYTPSSRGGGEYSLAEKRVFKPEFLGADKVQPTFSSSPPFFVCVYVCCPSLSSLFPLKKNGLCKCNSLLHGGNLSEDWFPVV